MICVPIVGSSMPKALEQIDASEKVADILELRLDLMDSPDLDTLLKAVNKPVIVEGNDVPPPPVDALALAPSVSEVPDSIVPIES